MTLEDANKIIPWLSPICAAVLGFLIGWVVRNFLRNELHTNSSRELRRIYAAQSAFTAALIGAIGMGPGIPAAFVFEAPFARGVAYAVCSVVGLVVVANKGKRDIKTYTFDLPGNSLPPENEEK